MKDFEVLEHATDLFRLFCVYHIIHFAVRLPHTENNVPLLLRFYILHHRPAPADFLRFRSVRVVFDAGGLLARLHNQPTAAFEFGTSVNKSIRRVLLFISQV